VAKILKSDAWLLVKFTGLDKIEIALGFGLAKFHRGRMIWLWAAWGFPIPTAITKQACKSTDSAIYHPFER